MKAPPSIQDFVASLNAASKDDFGPLEAYLTELRPQLRHAAERDERGKWSQHIDYLLLATAIAAICSWHPPHRNWSLRLNRLLRARLPGDLSRTMRRIDRRCCNRPPKTKVCIHAPRKWSERSWVLAPHP